MPNLVSLDILLDRYKNNRASIKVQIKPPTKKANNKPTLKIKKEPLDPKSNYYILNSDSTLYLGVINFKCEILAQVFKTTLRTESIIHTYSELPYVENVLKSREIKYNIVQIKSPDKIGDKH